MTDRDWGFLKSLIFAGEIIGIWAAVGLTALFGLGNTVSAAGFITVVGIALIAWDVRKAWKRYRMENPQ